MRTTKKITTTEQRRGQWLKGVLDLCVLARLSYGQAYGYELARGLEEDGFGAIKGGTLYPLLNRLERDEMVATYWRPSDQGPDRKYYRITASGIAALRNAAPAWADFAAAVAHSLATADRKRS